MKAATLAAILQQAADIGRDVDVVIRHGNTVYPIALVVTPSKVAMATGDPVELFTPDVPVYCIPDPHDGKVSFPRG